MKSKDRNSSVLTYRFEEALNYAYRLHANQKRKGTQIPYVAHLFGVTALVLEYGGGEDEAIAALLHDAVEDQGGINTLKIIQERFGERVAHIVESLTDSFEKPKPDWETRKVNYLSHLKDVSPEVRRVSLADKLHNARSILATLQSEGEKTWLRFSGGKQGTLWYYNSLAKIFSETGDDYMTREFARLVSEINRAA
jgi:(p)ppGpp synthase/HD superfamily hydrolase